VQRLIMESRRLQLCQEEGAAAVLAPSRGDGGGIFVQGIDIPDNPDSSMTGRPRIYEMNTEHLSPQIVVAAEHYSRLVRIVQKGRNLRLELDLQVDRTAADSGFNVLAEITGSDLKDEVVMVGGHLDSWHGGTGATDNATGVATSMEAVRILQTLQVKPRRTIRLALWGGEEQGLLGSRAFVRRHLARFPPGDSDSRGRSSDTLPSLTPAGEKFSCYFNNDNGTGRIRGVYLQGQDELRPLFRAWLAPFRGMGASTLTSRSTSSTDHISFTAAGLPGFQFIQDDIEYFTRTWHSTMDVYDRAQEQDLKQSAAIMASFLYHAAMRNEPLPRRQVTRWPAPR
jgi:Zn-dependent M28 family amino/carboxypeptidase